jgi:plasmid stability protein
MRNVTITLDDEVYRAARVTAARRGQSLSALVRSLLSAVDGGALPYAAKAARLFDVMDGAQTPYCATRRKAREALYER